VFDSVIMLLHAILNGKWKTACAKPRNGKTCAQPRKGKKIFLPIAINEHTALCAKRNMHNILLDALLHAMIATIEIGTHQSLLQPVYDIQPDKIRI